MMFDYKDQEAYFRANMSILTGYYAGKTEADDDVSTYYFQFCKQFRTKAIVDAPLADPFVTGGEKLIPIIYSHGNMYNRNAYQMPCYEFAANGHIVFALTFRDGSSNYEEYPDFSGSEWNYKNPIPGDDVFSDPANAADAQPWYETHNCRVGEISSLIDELFADNFLE